MSFDIHGNPLRRGHCEVHPHVAEEYPCFICIDDKRKYSIDRYRELELHKLKIAECTIARLVEALEGLLKITDESLGVLGYHLNGNMAKWCEFDEVKMAEEALASYRRQGGDV